MIAILRKLFKLCFKFDIQIYIFSTPDMEIKVLQDHPPFHIFKRYYVPVTTTFTPKSYVPTKMESRILKLE